MSTRRLSRRRPGRVPPDDLTSSELRLGRSRFLVLSFEIGSARPSPADPSLTAAEREVLALLLAGRTNAEIARRRTTSVRTVANQLASLYRKLGVSGRREILARTIATTGKS